ncbi:MAG TPA: MFS transporter [Solirubrobacteraceae bacterium]|nr:MFS transporter [Solirubrobacteraceae bacterium]
MSATDPMHSRRWLILAIVGLAQLMVVLDATVVNIALPSAQRALGFSNGERQWIVTGYALAFGSLLPLGGRIGDLFGRKRAFMTGLIGFAVMSAIAGLAQSFGWLVAARAAQGAFAALLAPAALAVLTTTFRDSSDRNRAFGIFGAIAGSGGAVGLLLGGVLTQYLSWRWTLYVNVLLALPTATGVLMLLNEHRATAKPHLDIPGTLTASSGLGALVYGFSHAQSSGWGSPLTIACLSASVFLLAVFVAIERTSPNPLLPLRVLADRNRSGAYVAVLVTGIGLFGVILLLTYYLQGLLGYSPIKTGLAFLPMVAATILTSTTTSTLLLARLGPRPLVVAGMVITGCGMALLTRLGLRSTYASDILPALLAIGVGVGMVATTSINTATAGITPADSGIASALVNTSQQVGGSIGTALLNTLATTAAASFVRTHATGAAVLARATVHGNSVAFWTGAAVFAVGAVVCGLLLHPLSVRAAPAVEPVPAHHWSLGWHRPRAAIDLSEREAAS